MTSVLYAWTVLVVVPAIVAALVAWHECRRYLSKGDK